jgi:hypothetical protein
MTKKIKFITGLSHINNVLKKYIGVLTMKDYIMDLK